jgi:hypothetical protein
MSETGAGENRKTKLNPVKQVMIKKLKMFSMAALVTVAAGTSVRAAAPTNLTVLDKVSISLVAYVQDPNVTNKPQTLIAYKSSTSGFNTKALLQAISVASGIAINTNTSALGYTNLYVLTNGYVVVYTNAGQGTLSTNTEVGTNWAGLTNAATEGLTIASNSVYAFVTSGWAIVTGTTISGVSNVNFGADAGPFGGGSGHQAAFEGTPLSYENIPWGPGAASYAIAEGDLGLNTTSNTWTVNVNGTGGSSSMASVNLGTGKAPAFIGTKTTTVPVYGGGKGVTAISTNYYDFKGTETWNFWKFIP